MRARFREVRVSDTQDVSMFTKDWFLNASMEELIDIAFEDDVADSTLQMWCIFKIAQFLEKIAYAPKE